MVRWALLLALAAHVGAPLPLALGLFPPVLAALALQENGRRPETIRAARPSLTYRRDKAPHLARWPLRSTESESIMAWRQDSAASFSGGSGQMAVIAELLQRQCNAAIPHIDVGTDVFAFRDDREEVARIQFETDTGKRYKRGGGFHAKVGIPTDQLRRTDSPPLFYALVVRLDDAWAAFLIISRSALQTLCNEGLGYDNSRSGNLELHVQFRPSEDAGEAQGGQGGQLTARFRHSTSAST